MNTGTVVRKATFDLNAINPEEYRTRKPGIEESKTIETIRQSRLNDFYKRTDLTHCPKPK